MRNIENLTVEFALITPTSAFEADKSLAAILSDCKIQNAAISHTQNTISITFEQAADKQAFYNAFQTSLTGEAAAKLFTTDQTYSKEAKIVAKSKTENSRYTTTPAAE